MTPREFVGLFYNEKTDYLKQCFDESANLFVSKKIQELDITDEQKKVLKEIVDGILIDTYYTILLGLDGSANIGGQQILYKIYDEKGNLLTDGGEIEAAAWDFFHNKEDEFLS